MKKIYFTLIGLLGLHLFLLTKLQFTAWPEMFSFPYLFNNGFRLYGDMVHPYPPVLTLSLSILYKLFGYKLAVLKVATWTLILANDILIFLIVKKATGQKIFAFLSLIFYLTLQPFLDGNQLWFDLAIVTPVLFGILFFLNKKYFWAGVAFAFAALTKQTAGIFLVASGLWLVIGERKIGFLFRLLVGPLVLFLILLGRLLSEGAVSEFFNWTLIYPLVYWNKFPGYVQMFLTGREWFIVVVLSLPLVFLVFRKNYLLFTIYYLLSLLIVYPRFSFFHLQLAIAISAILFGLSLKFLKFSPMFLATCYILLATFMVVPVLKSHWQRETRFWGRSDLELAAIIKKEASGDIYLLGPFSSLYVMSGTLPPKPWLDNFGWYFEIPGVQAEVIRRWKQNPPEVIIWQETEKGEWYEIGTYQPVQIAIWIKENYNQEKEIKRGVFLWRKK